jgi:uncharacterized membrane protein YidH (DUF202 family)
MAPRGPGRAPTHRRIVVAERIPEPRSQAPDDRPTETRERTLLAGDRTLLAWYRTAFGAYALAVGLGGVVPAVAMKASSFYRVLGVIFAVLGASAVLLGVWHHLVFQRDAGPGHLPRSAGAHRRLRRDHIAAWARARARDRAGRMTTEPDSGKARAYRVRRGITHFGWRRPAPQPLRRRTIVLA